MIPSFFFKSTDQELCRAQYRLRMKIIGNFLMIFVGLLNDFENNFQ